MDTHLQPLADPTAKGAFDVAFARRQFPTGLWDWAMFENAGGAFVPESVIQRMTDYMRQCQVQPGAPYPASTLAAERMAEGHRLMAALIGAAPEEVVIAASTSINIYVLAHALRPLWADGDEVIVTNLNHEANSSPWRRLADSGIRVMEWPVHPDTGVLEIDLLDDLLSERTRLVAFPHVSNITGDINDVAAITKKVHDAGAMVCVDGVAHAPHRFTDVKAWDVDFYAFSFYKVFGPHMGCLYGKRERLLEARGQYHDFFDEDAIPAKLNPAGPQHEMIASLAGIADYFDALAAHHLNEAPNDFTGRARAMFDLIAAHEERLAAPFVDFATTNDRVRLLGRQTAVADQRAPTFSFTVDGMRSNEIETRLRDDRIAVRHGHFYVKRLITAVGIDDMDDGVVRASMAHTNTEEEVHRLVAALERVIGSA